MKHTHKFTMKTHTFWKNPQKVGPNEQKCASFTLLKPRVNFHIDKMNNYFFTKD